VIWTADWLLSTGRMCLLPSRPDHRLVLAGAFRAVAMAGAGFFCGALLSHDTPKSTVEYVLTTVKYFLTRLAVAGRGVRPFVMLVLLGPAAHEGIPVGNGNPARGVLPGIAACSQGRRPLAGRPGTSAWRVAERRVAVGVVADGPSAGHYNQAGATSWA
jgi:hypothetical protein